MKKIIVAEDDKFLANAYKLKLTKLGYEVASVADGDAVLEYLESGKPDLIILDLIMPIRDGFSTLEEIRKNPKWKAIPIIIASNLGQKEDIANGMALGATDYIVKSDLSLGDLGKKIEKLLA